jgi:hypothetical protein
MTAGAASTGPTSAPRRKRRLWLKIGLPVILIPIAAIALWIWATLGYTYSTGERTGYVQKLSHKGWVCKTWEGELAMSPVPGSPPQMFDFTVRSDSLARALEMASGKMVTLNYAQHKGVPGNCFGETEYYVESFRIAGGP